MRGVERTQRFAIAIVVAMSMCAICFGQQVDGTATLSSIFSGLGAADWSKRADAYVHLRAIPRALGRADVRRALLDLLDRENRVIEATLRESNGRIGVSGKYGEEYTEYVGELNQTVESFADWTDPRQVCIFARKSYSPESRFAAKLAAHGKLAAACLLEMSRSDVWIIRGKAASVLVQYLAIGTDIQPAVAKQVNGAVDKALEDAEEGVRLDTIDALARFGKPDMIPALRRVAASDAAIDPTDNSFWLRTRAAKAIAAIDERAKTSTK